MLATPLDGQRHLVVDGAHRVSALRQIGAELALVQVVEPDECQLSAWHHLARLRHPSRFDNVLVDRCPACAGGETGEAGRCVAVTHLCGRTAHAWCPSGNIADAVGILHLLASSYAADGLVKRIAPADRAVPPVPDCRIRVAYQPWSFDRLSEAAGQGLLLPAGITRFVVPGRILGADLPLYLLLRNHGVAVTRIRRHVQNLRLRYYAEPLFIAE